MTQHIDPVQIQVSQGTQCEKARDSVTAIPGISQSALRKLLPFRNIVPSIIWRYYRKPGSGKCLHRFPIIVARAVTLTCCVETIKRRIRMKAVVELNYRPTAFWRYASRPKQKSVLTKTVDLKAQDFPANPLSRVIIANMVKFIACIQCH